MIPGAQGPCVGAELLSGRRHVRRGVVSLHLLKLECLRVKRLSVRLDALMTIFKMKACVCVSNDNICKLVCLPLTTDI